MDLRAVPIPFLVKAAALSGVSAVLLGAFGAHALKARLGEESKLLKTWDTASHYHLIHSVVLLLSSHRATSTSGNLFTAGICLFSGSLYAMVLTGHKWLGAITPIGGLLLAGGWLSLLV